MLKILFTYKFQKMNILLVRRYPIFYQFLRNAFLDKIRLNQGKITFRIKVTLFKKSSRGQI